MLTELRMFGPPGTGKTTRLVERVAKAAEKFGEDRVLVLSHTRAAAHELLSRKMDISRDNVGTLHAICYRLLGSPKIAEGEVATWNAENPDLSVSKINPDIDEGFAETDNSLRGDVMLGDIGKLRARMVDPATWSIPLQNFYARWCDWKRSADLLDFTDLIETCLNDVSSPGSFDVAFVDEAQDLVPMQMKLVRKWAESMEYMLVVGDEDQLLYGFCGATPKTMMEPAIDPKHIEILGQSYRVPRSVHALAESMIRRVMKRVEKNYKPREEDGEVLPCVATTREPSSLMSILEKHDKAGESTMILASCSYMLANTLSLLRREGVPFHNPYRKRRGDWNPLAKRKNSQGALDRLLSFLQPSADFPPEWSHGQLAAWSKHVAAQYMKRGAKALLAGEGIEVLTYRDAFEGKEREYLCDFINGAIESETALTWLVERMLASKRPTYRYPLKVIVKRGIEKAQETPRIIPGTIHSTKGGEADNVIIFPDVSNAGFRELVSGGEAADAVIRMFYVGVTRARKRLYICEPTTTARFKIR